MFSLREKRMISEAVQKILRDTNHPELPEGEIVFSLHVAGASNWSWADIRNNETQDPLSQAKEDLAKQTRKLKGEES